jgi:hypothetical protein
MPRRRAAGFSPHDLICIKVAVFLLYDIRSRNMDAWGIAAGNAQFFRV